MSDRTVPTEHIRLKRIYEPPSPKDGVRVLVDRLWPRGLRKNEAAVARWVKDIAPSPQLRQWFGHDAERWPEFRRRYSAELRHHAQALEELRELARHHQVTLLFGARDEARNDAVVLRDVLLNI